MGTIFGIIVAVLLVFGLLFAGGCSPWVPSPPVVTVSGIKSLDRAAVRALLKRLADTPPPTKLSAGASCYKPISLPDRADYICPKCGERTLYIKDGSFDVKYSIPDCRGPIKEIRELAGNAISFDESQFCRKCSPKVRNPKLILRIAFAGEPTREIERFNADDLRILRDFLAGKLVSKNGTDWELPLKSSLPRLQELLGVKLDEPAKKQQQGK